MSANCPLCHAPWKKNVSKSEKNPNRVYNSCTTCFVEKPGEFWCWDGEEPNAFKVHAVKAAMAKRTQAERPLPDRVYQVQSKKRVRECSPPPRPAKRVLFDGEDSDSSPELPRSGTDVIVDRQETRLEALEKATEEIKAILARIEEVLKKEYQ